MKFQMRQSKLPQRFPEWLVKASWDATALMMTITAKTEEDAWNIAWKKVSRMFGGNSCKKVTIVRQL